MTVYHGCFLASASAPTCICSHHRRITNYTVGNGNTIAQLVSSAEQQETATADILDKDAELGTRDDIEEPRWRLCVCFEQTRCNWLISGPVLVWTFHHPGWPDQGLRVISSFQSAPVSQLRWHACDLTIPRTWPADMPSACLKGTGPAFGLTGEGGRQGDAGQRSPGVNVWRTRHDPSGGTA